MGLFRRSVPVEERAFDLSAYANIWSDTVGYSPVAVSIQTALSHAASSACIDALASSVSSLPVDVVRPSGGSRLPVSPVPQVVRQPSQLVEQDVWMYQLLESVLTDGNGFAEITSYQRGLPASLDLVAPGDVTMRRLVNGVPTVRLAGMDRQLFPWGDLWHLPGKFVSAGSPFAASPVDRARSTIGGAIAARDFGAQFFGDGGHPGAVIKSETELTKEQAAAVKQSFIAATRGNREPAVIGSGFEYQPIMVSPNDSQFLDLQRFAIEEACRFWRVPPSMVYAATSGQNVTYSNVSQADLAYLKHSLDSHLVRVERALTRLLPSPQVVRFNRNAFLRADPQTRSEVVDRRLRNETMTVNEARALEDERPFGGGVYDEPGIPADNGNDMETP